MNESLKGVKRHETERMMAVFLDLCELSLNSLEKHFQKVIHLYLGKAVLAPSTNGSARTGGVQPMRSTTSGWKRASFLENIRERVSLLPPFMHIKSKSGYRCSESLCFNASKHTQ